MKINNTILAIVLLIVGLGAGFFAGEKYQQNQSGNRTAQFALGGNGGRFRVGNGGNGANFRPVAGQILSVDPNGITVKMQDGSSKIVILSDTTSISKTGSGTKADLKTGDMVAVFGTTNSDGSVTAQNVQLNPMFRLGGNPRPVGQ